VATPETLTWFETYNSARLAMSLVIEGTPTVFATDVLTGSYSGDVAPFNAFADPVGGLHIEGALAAAFDLYTQDIKPEELSFRVTDRDGILAGTLLREAYGSGHRTYLTSSVLAGATATISVKDTTGFAASGTIYIGDEAIAYTGKTATTFTGITRGKFAINQTDAGAAFSPSHLIGNNVTTSATTAPAVSDFPRTWYGRWVHLLIHVKDPLTEVYNFASDAYRVFSGRMQSYGDNGDGSITITARSAIGELNRAIGQEQWHGLFNEGLTLDGTADTLYVFSALTPTYAPTAALAFAGHYSHDKVAALVQAQFDAWRAAVTTRAGDIWSIMLIDSGNGPRYRIRLEPNTTALPISSLCGIGLHKKVWNLLGWDGNDGFELTSSVTGDLNVHRSLSHVTNNLWEIVAPKPPVIYFERDLITGTPFAVSSQIGTFVPQTVSDIDTVFSNPDVNGVIQIDGGPFDQIVYAVKFTAGSPTASLIVYAQLDPQSGQFRQAGNPVPVQNGTVRMGDARRPPIVKQVWFEHGPAGQALLKALLSTGGASGFNHATYDVRTTVGFGAGVPASLVDVASWEDLDDVTLALIVSSPRPFYELLEPVLQATNRYVVWKAIAVSAQPKLTIVRPTLDNSVNLVWQLSESNKAASPDRVKITRAADGIINRVVVNYGYGLDGNKDSAKKWILEDIASQSDFGRRRTVTLEAPGVTNVEQVTPDAIAPALAYFSRPLAIAERSYNASLLRMAPGDAVAVTDNYMVDPTTGTRGGVVYGWVLATKFDLKTGRGSARIVFLPEKLPRVMRWAPSARVDETANTGGFTGGYNPATKDLKVKLHEFTNQEDFGDGTYFSNLDKVHIYALDENPPSLEWFDTVNGNGGATTVRLTTGLAGFDAAKRYVIEFDDIVTVQSSQRTSHAYIADDADLSTGGVVPTAYDWGIGPVFSQPLGSPAAAPVYTQGMFQPNSLADDKGEPVSIHKQTYLVWAANNFYSYKSRQMLLDQWLETAGAQTGTTPKLVFMAWVPVYSHRARGLRVKLYVKQAGGGTATFTVRSSPFGPTGASFTTHTFPGGSTSVQGATTSATLEWTAELLLTCSPSPAVSGVEGLLGTWITVEAEGSAGGIIATLQAISVWEAEL
jgi:hypothetical protein